MPTPNTCNSCQTDNETNYNCYLIQNFQLLIDNIPTSLQNLSYAIYPNDLRYNDLRLNYNKIQNIFPQALFYPNTEDEIAYLINEFVKNNQRFAIRCGGHGYEPSSLSNKYVLNVTQVEKKIVISDDRSRITCNSGILLRDVIIELSKHSLIATIGESPCVGLSGLALSGGIGVITRLYGLACQNIVSVKIINYQGKILQIDKTNYSDLFWAVKGAGCGNFGVVTEIEMKVYDDIFLECETLTWNWNKKNAFLIFKLYQQEITQYPNNISANLTMTYNAGTANFSIKFYKLGKVDMDISSIFKKIGKPNVTFYSGSVSQCFNNWGDIETGNNGCFSKIKSSLIFRLINDTGIKNLVNSLNYLLILQVPVNYSLNFLQLGGAVANGNGSFAFKNVKMVLTYYSEWNNNNLSSLIINYMKNVYRYNIKYLSKFCMPTFIDYDIVNYMEKYYGKNKNILTKIKQKYDPLNIFKYQQSIPINNRHLV